MRSGLGCALTGLPRARLIFSVVSLTLPDGGRPRFPGGPVGLGGLGLAEGGLPRFLTGTSSEEEEDLGEQSGQNSEESSSRGAEQAEQAGSLEDVGAVSSELD